jgi:hypothetical protein
VGLVFFIFILHYATFLHHKAKVDKSSREFAFLFIAGLFVFAFLFFFSTPVDLEYTAGLEHT